MRFLDFVLHNVLRRKVRSMLTGIGVALAMAAVVALLGVAGGFERSFMEVYQRRGVDLMVVRAGVSERLASSIHERFTERLLALPGVDKVSPSLNDTVTTEGGNAMGLPLRGWRPDSFAFDGLRIKKGRKLTAADHDGVLLGTALATNLKKDVGDTTEFETHPFKVVGIYESDNVFENGAALVLLDSLQQLMDRGEQVTEFQVALKPDLPDKKVAIDKLKRDIENLRDEEGKRVGLAALSSEEFVRGNFEIRMARAMAWVTSTIALVIGAIGMLNTMIMSVLERTQEIGVLRAIGWRRWSVVRMILTEALLLSMGGTLLGTLSAVGLIRFLSQFPATQGFLRGDVSLDVILTGFVLSLGMALVGGAYPALRGANLSPIEALRYE